MRSQYIVNTIYKNTDVSVFLAGKNVPAKVYTAATESRAIDTLPQITSDDKGTINFYVDTSDYGINQLFDIKIGKVGIKYKFTINDVYIFDVTNIMRSTYLNKSGKTKAVGTNDKSSIKPDAGYSSIEPLQIVATIGGTNNGTETISGQVVINFTDSTSVTLTTKSLVAGAIGDINWELVDIIGSIQNGKRIASVDVSAASDAATTATTVVGTVRGKQEI